MVEEALIPQTTFFGLIVEEGATDFENRSHYDYVLDSLARKSGGVFATSLTPMGASSELRKLLSALKAQYRLTYATLPSGKERKLELTVARPGVKVRLASPTGKRS